MTTDPRSVEGEIARSEARLAELRREEARLQSRLQRLRREVGDGSCPSSKTDRPATPAQKIRLFRSIVRGRRDVAAL